MDRAQGQGLPARARLGGIEGEKLSMRYLSEIYTLRFGECGMSRAEAAAWLGITPRTLQRHEYAFNPPQGPIYRALRLRAGFLEDIDPAWRGWRLVRGRLFWPGDRYGFSAGEILAMRFDLQRLAQLERELRELRAAVDLHAQGKRSAQPTAPLARESLPVTQDSGFPETHETTGQIVAIAPYLQQRNGG